MARCGVVLARPRGRARRCARLGRAAARGSAGAPAAGGSLGGTRRVTLPPAHARTRSRRARRFPPHVVGFAGKTRGAAFKRAAPPLIATQQAYFRQPPLKQEERAAAPKIAWALALEAVLLR